MVSELLWISLRPELQGLPCCRRLVLSQSLLPFPSLPCPCLQFWEGYMDWTPTRHPALASTPSPGQIENQRLSQPFCDCYHSDKEQIMKIHRDTLYWKGSKISCNIVREKISLKNLAPRRMFHRMRLAWGVSGFASGSCCEQQCA